VPVQRRVHVVDPAIVRSGNGMDPLVDKLIVIHAESLSAPQLFEMTVSPFTPGRVSQRSGSLGYPRGQIRQT